MQYTLDSTVGQIMRNEQLKAAIEKELPRLAGDPRLGYATAMSLRQCRSYAPELLDNATMEKLKELLAAAGA